MQYIFTELIKKGGAIAKNCAIVGALIGAILSIENLNGDYITKILMCEVSNNVNNARPDIYEPRRLYYITLDLLSCNNTNNDQVQLNKSLRIQPTPIKEIPEVQELINREKSFSQIQKQAVGCVLGALIGDGIGMRLRYINNNDEDNANRKKNIDEAMMFGDTVLQDNNKEVKQGEFSVHG